MPRAIRGVLIECEPAIKSIIVNIDSERNEYIVADLDDTHLVVNEGSLPKLKMKLDERLAETLQDVAIDSDSDK